MISVKYLLSLLSLASRPATAGSTLSHKPSDVRTIHQWALGVWAENIAVRPNGNLLVTFVTPYASVHEINPFNPPNSMDPAATVLYAFSNATSSGGIAELSLTPDTFAIVAGNTVYHVDLRPATYSSGGNSNSPTRVKPIATISGAETLNGMTSLPGTSILLIADSVLGAIWRLDVRTGAYSVLLQHSTMAPSDADPNLPFLGINGIKYGFDGHVYYNNSPRRLYCRVPIDPGTGDVVGEAQVIAEGEDVLGDDFAVRLEMEVGDVGEVVGYLAGSNDNVVTRVTLDGATEIVAGNLNSSALAGGTAAAWGRTTETRTTLFVTTGGGTGLPVNGTYVEGGKVVALRFER